MRKTIAFAALVIMVSCTSGQISQIETDFSSVVSLDDCSVIDIPDCIERLEIRGDCIILKVSSEEQQACLMDFSSNSRHYFLARGRGPGETTNLLDISFYDEHTVQASVDPESVMLFDVDSLMNGKTAPEFVYKLADGHYAFPNIVKLPESVLYCGKNTGSSSNSTNYCIEEVGSGSIRGFGPFPDDEITNSIPSNDYSLQTAYQAKIRTSPDNKRAVAYYFYILGFEILDTEKADVVSSRLYSPLGAKVTQNEILKASLVTRDPDAMRGFLDVAVTERYIYLLSSLKRFNEEDYNKGRDIFRFLWDGRPDKHFQLKFPTGSIAVSSDDKVLYAIKNETDHDALVKYAIH